MSKPVTLVQRTPVQIKQTAHGEVVQVDITKLPRPNRTVACNALDARLNGSSVELVFGQRHPGKGSLVAALIVSIPRGAVPLLLNKAENPNFRQRVDAFLAKEGIVPADMKIEPSDYPERLVFERASTMSMSHADHEADIRFFRVLPTDFRRMQVERNLTADFLDPVVEIALSTEHLACLIAKLDELAIEQGSGG